MKCLGYCVKIDRFEGPLELLLHLISKSKINIEDISINEITCQYIEYLQQMQQFDIEIASEFLVMAATLIHIKSRKLLPKLKEDENEGDDINTREQLIQRLLDYKKFKEISNELREREQLYSHIYSKLPEEIAISKEELDDRLFGEVGKEDLFNAICIVLSKKNLSKSKSPGIYEIAKDPISIKQRIEEIEGILCIKEKATFFSLFENDYNKSEVITTFLAILEMIKNNNICLYQSRPFDDIIIKKRKI